MKIILSLPILALAVSAATHRQRREGEVVACADLHTEASEILACQKARVEAFKQAKRDQVNSFKAYADAKKSVNEQAVADQRQIAVDIYEAGKEAKAEAMQKKADQVADKQAQRDAKQEAYAKRQAAIILKLQQREKWFENKALLKAQKEAYPLRKALQIAQKVAEKEARQQLQVDREAARAQKRAMAAFAHQILMQQKAAAQAQNAEQKEAFKVKSMMDKLKFLSNQAGARTEQQTQRSQWMYNMEEMRIQWAAKTAGLFEDGHKCTPHWDSTPTIVNGEEIPEFNFDASSWPEAQEQVVSVSFTHATPTDHFLLVSTTMGNKLYAISTATADGSQDNLSVSDSYSYHDKASEYFKISGVEAVGNYVVSVLHIGDAPSEDLKWFYCPKV